MDKEKAWLLGYLLSDGSIISPKYRSKGDETHLSFICMLSDREILDKVKKITKTKAKVHEYPNYKSPHAKLRIYDRRDIIDNYSDIKTRVPEEDIKGYERHFIRGLIDGDGTLSVRKNRKTFRIGFIDQYEQIVEWVTNFLVDKLGLPEKRYRYVPQSHVWEVMWEGTIAKLISWYLYHGDIEECCLKRKHEKYKESVLNGEEFENIYDEMMFSINAGVQDNWIKFQQKSSNTLKWCHMLQKILPYKTTPVFKNPGSRKYYNLYIPNNVSVVNTRDAQEFV